MNTQISVDVNEELKIKLRKIAKKNGVPLSMVVRLGLEAGLEQVDRHLSALKAGISQEPTTHTAKSA